jgi:hypothetical protein
VKQIEWTEASLDDMAALDKGIARRVKQAAERFAETGTGSVKKLQGIDPPEYRLRFVTTGYDLNGGRDLSHSPRSKPPGAYR